MPSYNLRRALHSVSCELIEGASVNGKPPVSKTGTAGSIPVAPAKNFYFVKIFGPENATYGSI